MNQEFMDPEVFSEFIVEAREHLENIEPSLLELEKNPDDPGLLDDIFRLMHSLKGASGFLGLSRINGLTHKAENILDEIRKGNMNLTPAITDLILVSTDALKAMVENLEQNAVEGDVETSSIIEKIDNLLKDGHQSVTQDASSVASPNPHPSVSPPQDDAEEVRPAMESMEDVEPELASQGYELTLVNQDHLGDFLEEAREILEQLNENLLDLEKNPESGGDIVNDIFRFFHNLKGNSGIIGYKELNKLTHEAETLLNKVRKEEVPVTHGLVDLLLNVVDSMDALLACIQLDGRVIPVDVSAIIQRVRYLLETGEIKAPENEGPNQEQPDTGSSQEGQDESAVMVDPEDVQIFSQTVAQQLSNLDFALSALEEDSTQQQIIDGLYRSLVSIQNASGYMGMDEINAYVQRVTALVDQARSADMDFTALIDILRQERDIVREKINAELDQLGEAPLDHLVATSWGNGREEDAVSAEEPRPCEPETIASDTQPSRQEHGASSPERPQPVATSPQPASQPGKPAAKSSGTPAAHRAKLTSTIRVDHTKLDHLMNLIGELIINRNRFAMLARGLEEGQDVGEIAQKLSETTYSVGRISDDLQDTIMNVRMVPVQSVFSRFPRLVRDLAQKSGKQVELITEGEDTELDKSVVEEIGDPLVHLIRNAVDHGIDSAEDRARAGKPETARVWLRAFHKGNSVGIEVEDDGKGIDPEKMRAQAIRKGVITEEEARTLDDRAAVELMFVPGFSTADKITDISGRGVGMDVVRNNIKNLKGSISVQSEVGKGTRITLTLPLTLAIIDALMIKVDGATYAIPLDAVSETTKIETKRLNEVNGQKAVTLRGEVLGLVELAELLGLSCHEGERDFLPTVILTVNERRLGLVVDALLERQDVVIKSLGDYLGDLPGISGATIMGDGSVVLILDPHEIYRMATSRGGI
ncbi:chemotaxis protein CheA [Desulfoplanes formicivorans]|uniref:Chemotaxis protein CheA n=1 Tax=Desulfoplanes formicivorans TaxID=1592317 RepID=A0A194AME0_9BACT|nr:chemotaxis protein CheA [Desulfoplanes formicivorans]GAU09804.1 chemotaxis protein CheA [Desulfoplanes formicivorans]